MKPPRRILIVRTDRLGDVILTLPMARAIKIAWPDAHIGFYCREYTRSIVERCPDVDEVIVREENSGLSNDIRTLRAGKWDAVFFPNARPHLALAAFLARIPVRVGTAYRFYSLLFNRRIREHRKTAERHEAEYNLRMLTAIGVNAAPTIAPSLVLRFEEIQNVQRWKRDTLAGEERYAVLHIGSGGSSHSWPVEHWTTLARSLAEDRQIVITGTNAEREALTPILTALRIFGIVAYQFIGHSLPELAALLAGADVVVSGSTGPGHLAAALGAKTIGLFPLPLALSKERWGFRGRRAVNLSPARLSDCPSCKICNCMERIAVESVFTATRR